MDCLSPDSSKEQRKCLELPPHTFEEQSSCLELSPHSSEKQGSCFELPLDLSKEQGNSLELPSDMLEEHGTCLELPPDVMSLIFLKLGAIEILCGAQSVCFTGRKLSKEPQLWRSVDMRKRRDSFFGDEYIMEKMAREAVDRSCGQLVEFSVERFATDELLEYITDSNDGLIEIAQKLPMLEKLELCHCEFATEVLEVVGHLCAQLKLFRLNYRTYWPSSSEGDNKALAIATSMTQLRHLDLSGNMLTDTGLRAILDGCAHLESLDLRRCFNLDLKGDLLKRCIDGIRNLRLPEDSTDDYEFDTDGDDHEFDNEYEFGAQRVEHDFYLDRDEYYAIFGGNDEYESDHEFHEFL